MYWKQKAVYVISQPNDWITKILIVYFTFSPFSKHQFLVERLMFETAKLLNLLETSAIMKLKIYNLSRIPIFIMVLNEQIGWDKTLKFSRLALRFNCVCTHISLSTRNWYYKVKPPAGLRRRTMAIQVGWLITQTASFFLICTVNCLILNLIWVWAGFEELPLTPENRPWIPPRSNGSWCVTWSAEIQTLRPSMSWRRPAWKYSPRWRRW